MSKNENKIILSLENAPQEDKLVEFDLVKLQKTWAFWECYEMMQSQDPKEKKNWKDLQKKIFEFNDIITFWQITNCSPYSKFGDIFYNGERTR